MLTAEGLTEPEVLSCTFDRVDATDAGDTAIGICAVGRAKAPGRLMFTLTGAGASRALTISGGPFSEPVALQRCPNKPPIQAQAVSSISTQGG